MKHIAFTGHRPKDLRLGTRQAMFTSLDTLRVGQRRDISFITGGAMGVDRWAAEYARQHDLPYRVILPFPESVMTRFWPTDECRAFDIELRLAESVSVLGGERYDPARYQERNEAMVDAADLVLAVWTGKRTGGTANCVRYALATSAPIYNLMPFDGRLHRITAI